jgi:hypothetical protein
MAMSVRISFASHDRRLRVGSLLVSVARGSVPYFKLLCPGHPATCASASVSGSLASSSLRPLAVPVVSIQGLKAKAPLTERASGDSEAALPAAKCCH